MAEFTKVAKEYSRMCSAYPDCNECPINKARDKTCVCRYWVLVVDPEKAEEVIMDWAKEKPPITNNDKIKEIFGLDFKSTFTASPWTLEWLNEEYKEPEDGRSNEN